MLRTFIVSLSILSASAAFAVEPNAPPTQAKKPSSTTSTMPSTTTSATSETPALTPTPERVTALVNKTFAGPYYGKLEQRSRYSRMAMPPTEHRVRVTDLEP